MDRTRQWVVLTALGVVVVLALGWFLLISPKRSDATTINAQADAQQSANQVLETQLQVLKQEAADLPHQQAVLAAVAAKLPGSRALPALIRALSAASATAGVELVTITPGGTAVAAPVTVTAPVAPGAAAAPGTGVVVPAPRAATAGSLGTIPVTLSVAGGYFQIREFLNALENLPRAMRVVALTLAPGANPVAAASLPGATLGKTLVASISAQVYMAVGRAAAVAAVVPVAPTPVSPASPGAVPVVPSPSPSATPLR